MADLARLATDYSPHYDTGVHSRDIEKKSTDDSLTSQPMAGTTARCCHSGRESISC